MALNGVNIFLANSKYTYEIDGQQYCGGDADIFDINRKKSDIMIELINYINNGENGLIQKQGLIASFEYHENTEGNEDYYYFKIYQYIDGYSAEDYTNKGKEYGFGFIENRVV